ncbi:MAG: protocatechuate 3,4-dioxygenase beta subunit [Rhodothermales bacterium]|jgi:protocatechuate 3,4-dioxygenase beta subunit
MYILTRRRFIRQGSLATSLLIPGMAWAEALSITPTDAEGPFYPDKMPLDKDNDLIIINDSISPAVGQIAHVNGRLTDTKGKPIKNALIEIWQCDANGVYLHTRDPNLAKHDDNFQSYGAFETGSSGEYRFRTIKPVPYTGRTPHIHFAVSRGGRRVLTTQLYVKGEKGNKRDGLFNRIDADRRSAVLADFAAIPNSKTNELAATFNIVLPA